MDQYNTWRTNFKPKGVATDTRLNYLLQPRDELGKFQPRSDSMSEGNTAIQVSPFPQERTVQKSFNVEDPMSVRSFFEGIADTIVDASELRKIVEELRGELEKLRQDIEAVREANHRMDQEISELRTQRDQARSDVAALKDQVNALSVENYNTTQANSNLQQALSTAEHDRDAYQANYRTEVQEKEAALMKVLELEEQLKQATEASGHWQGRAEACERDFATIKAVFSK